MKLIRWLVLFAALPCFAQVSAPPYLVYGAGGSMFAGGSGAALGFTPPSISCYTIVSGSVVPCATSGGGATLPFPGLVYATSANGGSVATGAQVASAINKPAPGLTVSAEYPFTDQTGTTFADISGNGNNGTLCSGASAPAWNGDGLLILADMISNYQCANTPITNFKAVLIAFTSWPAGPLSSLSQTTTGNAIGGGPGAPFPTLLGPATTSTSAGGVVLLSKISAISYPITIYTQNGGTFTTQCAWQNGGNHILMYIPDASTDHIIVDGKECSYINQSGNASNVASTAAYTFGVGKLNASLAGRFILRYAKFYSTTEPTVAQAVQEESNVAGILSARAGIQQYPNFSATNSNIVVGIGDSLTAGFAGTAQWFSSTYVSTNNTYSYFNYGIGGSQATGIQFESGFRWYGAINPNAGTAYCHIWAGTNDVVAGISPSVIYQALVATGKQALAAGCKPIVATMISRNGYDTGKNSLNAVIRNGWQKDGFAALDDLAEIPAIGADGAYATTACFQADKTHLTGPGAGTCNNSLSGYSVAANGLGTIINMLDGYNETNPHTVTATYAMTPADRSVIANCGGTNCTITLPDCSYMTGQKFKVVNATSGIGVVSLAPFSGQNLYGSSSSITPLASTSTTFTDTLTAASSGGCFWTY